jgi:hypothetical protein
MINQNWVFGRHARLNFSTTGPVTSSNVAIDTFEGCASISDASGNLILYTDGLKVWDAANAVRAINLNGDPSATQSAIIVPNPGHVGQYYIFTAGITGSNQHVDGRLIDTIPTVWTVTPLSSMMTMPPTAGFSPTEKVTAIQHPNCKDFWVITIIQTAATSSAVGLGIIRVFLVNSTGVQHVGDTPINVPVHDLGYLKGSRNGKRIAIANWSNQNVLVYPFNNSTGTIDPLNPIPISVPSIPSNLGHVRTTYGVEFSPNSDILYYSVLGVAGANNSPPTHGYIFQHDLLTSSPSFQVGVHPNAAGRYALGALQLGMDDHIYIAQDGESTLGVIASPDLLGAVCSLTFGSLALASGSTCLLGLPNLISNPCPCACSEGNCDEAVDEANQTLNHRADDKFFTIIANGQVAPTTCELAFPQTNFAPIFTLHWGDGLSDQFESEDTEIIYIRIQNPFRNLIFRGVKVFNITVVPNQVLPNGEDALQLLPAEIACFDEIEACSYVSRDFAFLIKNAIVQSYKITFDYCIEEITVVGSGDGSALFDINVVAS